MNERPTSAAIIAPIKYASGAARPADCRRSTALFAISLRLASEVTEPPDGLLALAANPPLAPALTAPFNGPARPWTLLQLAQLCSMSRATFIRYFQERLARSASELLTDIRMTVGANALQAPDLSTGAAAELAGYQSEAAFQRAFQAPKGASRRPMAQEGASRLGPGPYIKSRPCRH